MNQSEFKQLYDRFNPIGAFSVADWDTALANWQTFYDEVISADGLPIEKWIKNPGGYLPDFLDTKEQKFGHARIGNYEQVMIYRYTGTDSRRNGKYRDAYANKDAHACVERLDDVETNYQNHIQSLLKSIASAADIDAIYVLEKGNDYEKFSCKQILRKITILCSLMDGSPYKHEFTWFFNDTALNNLAEILGVDRENGETFLQFNHKIYEIAKNYAGVTPTSTKDDYIKLYYFLLFLSDSSFNTVEFSDFRNNNLIFNGAPGTGKTYGVLKGIEKLQTIDGKKYRNRKYIQFHPAFSYQDFIEGIKPMGITAGGNVNLEVINGVFKAFCIHVRKENEAYWNTLIRKPDISNPSDFAEWPHYYFVVDEINRGNLSNIFGETFTLLEADYRDYDFSGHYTAVGTNLVSTVLSSVVAATGKTDLVYKGIDGDVYFGIPFNIHFIGIMNDVDKSIDAFDLALRRRFKWIPKYCDYDVIKDLLISNGYDSDEVESYAESCKALNDFICEAKSNGLTLGRTYEIGHAFFLKIRYTSGRKKITTAKKKEVFESYISGTLKEYIRLVAEETEIDAWVDKAAKAFGL